MKTFLMFQATFLLSCMDLNTGAELSLTVISPLGDTTINDLDIPIDFVCNAEATLLCEIKPYIDDSVTWQINGKTYAVCVLQNCVIYPPFPENHNFSMDVASGVFNLTVDPVTNCTNYNIYKCDDGITSRSVEAQVKVYSTNETLKMDTTAEDRLTVTTGCVYPNEIEDLTFEWYISKYNTTLESEPFTSKKNESTVIFDCKETPSCTASHFNNTVVFDVFDDGDEYYIYVIVKYNGAPNMPSTLHSTGRRYKVKDKDKSTPSYGGSKDDKPALDLVLIMVIVILITLFLVQLVIMCFLQCKIHSILSRASDGDSEISKRIGMTILGSIPVFGLIPIYITWKEFYRDVYQVTHGKHTKEDKNANKAFSNKSYNDVSWSKNGTISHEVHENEIRLEHQETEKNQNTNSNLREDNTDIQKQSSTVTAAPSSEHVGKND
ncbi:uncharacterized protein LOC123527326 isoform X2 [Mercenaria mercenaria]|uniref:uncharacterized protein LOC123527326 isoform X2 n=1 Tax=Mercenaria mercenaria TaxID=6596 RepID=UPI00234E8AB4|nr:uncharacterized protein LOC123527326 isoform X2 [Mercenaria mercenaria]